MTIRIGFVGVGKIARDSHIPALDANPDFTIVGAVTRHGMPGGVPTFADLDAMVAELPGLDAVVICTPPVGRHAIARAALDHGLHVMLEKPPGASLSELDDLPAVAGEKALALFATWHSRAAPAIVPAREWLADKTIRSVAITWKEDVRRWHPGQAWIWNAGSLGVFDPGINALSAVTAMLPRPPFVTEADLSFPANRDTPIAARLVLSDADGTAITADFDWRETGEQVWEIAVETDAGPLRLAAGGALLDIAGERRVDEEGVEYPGLYRQFATLVRERTIDFDMAPMKLVADAFLLGRRVEVAAFED